jgi:putative endonuclease
MEKNSKDYGAEGENHASNYLKTQGYQILERNWRFKKLEIDIIAKKNNLLVFVEVKTRKNSTFGEPEIFVTRKKQSFLIAAANEYIMKKNLDNEARFDIIAISQLNNNETVKHLEGAFYPAVK